MKVIFEISAGGIAGDSFKLLYINSEHGHSYCAGFDENSLISTWWAKKRLIKLLKILTEEEIQIVSHF